MFIDRVSIYIRGGNGGNGCISFHRAKYVTNGGPDGGDGGRGGSVIFQADESMTTLLDFRYRKKFEAQNGQDGSKNKCTGKDGEDLIIKIPVGTVIREGNSNKVMADFTKHGESRVLIPGGRGGKGNQHFATPTRQAPRYAERGKLAKSYDILLELKLIADVGIIGLPNVGKSTLLSMTTNANPKIANYHFTTLAPNLGVVRNKFGEDFVMADIPGLIEGASSGLGLGHEFLRHIERTRALIHVVDAAALEGTDPVGAINQINHELEAYSPLLMTRPQIIAANKMDIPEAEDNLQRLMSAFPDSRVVPISAATNSGLEQLMMIVAEVLRDCPKTLVFDEDFEPYDEIEPDQQPYTIERNGDRFVITGPGIERMLGYTNMENEKGFAFFQRYLRQRGIIAELEAMGINEGDTVELYGNEFEYYK